MREFVYYSAKAVTAGNLIKDDRASRGGRSLRLWVVGGIISQKITGFAA